MTRGPVDPRLLRHARTARGGIAALALLGAGQAAATLTVAAALTLLVMALADNRTGTGTALALLAGAFTARAALTWAGQVVARRTAARVTDELRRAVLAAALRRGPAWAAGFGTGRLSAVLGGGLEALRPWFSEYLPTLVLGVVLPPLVVAVMAVVDPASAVITLLTLPLVPLFGALIGWATQRRAKQRWAADARLAGHFLDVVRGLATLRLYGRARRQVAVVEAMTDRHRVATVRVLRVAFLSSTALDLVGTLSVGLVAVEVGLRVAAGDLGLGPALLVILLAPEAYRPLRETAARYHASADAAAVIADVDEVLAGSTAPRPERREQAAPGILATGLRVRHPGSTVDALTLPSLTVRRGEIVALRGASGAGKTTALRVLAGLQAMEAGEFRVSGPPPLYLPQRPTLPHARTVAEAVALDGETRPADAVVAEALRAVGVADELADPDAPLGEHGGGVSSGQRQRLALARLLREAQSRPAVLLLDEPTAHLDSSAERMVIGGLRSAAERGCAVLVVAHRPALLAAADRIVDISAPTDPGPAPRAAAPRPVTGPPLTASAGTTAAPLLSASPVSAAPVSASPVSAAPISASPVSASPGTTARPVTAFASPAVRGGVPPGGVASRGTPRPVAGLAGRSGAAAVLGAASWLAGVTLTGAATWLLVRASTLPPVLTLSTAVVLVRASAVARPLLRYLERLAAHETAFVRLGAWRSGVYADLIPRVPGRTLHRRGELLTRVVDDVDARVDGVLRGRLPATAAAMAVAVAVTAALLLHPAVGVVLLAGLALSGVLAPALAARHASRADAATGRARAELRDAVVETVDGLEELASRNPATALAVPVRRSAALATWEARSARTAGGAAALAQLGWGLAVTAVAVVVQTSGPELAAVLLLGAVALAEPVLALPDAAVARRRAAGARDRLAAIATQPPSVAPRSRQRPSGQPRSAEPSAAPGDLVVRDLVASWDPRRTPALRGLDLQLPAGARVAILGSSGSGKSTLAAVLVRLLDPAAGSVTLGGVDVCTMPTRDVRRRVGLVGDGADHIFASTVRENLRLARPEATDAQLRDALTRVRLDDWWHGLPDGLDTWLGEGASTISGGQQRRLATARALLADPEILVLDEPTEGLDQATAAALMADLLDAASGRSVLVLTHRLDGLDRVDAVHDLVDGRLRPAAGWRSTGVAAPRRPPRPAVRGTARRAS